MDGLAFDCCGAVLQLTNQNGGRGDGEAVKSGPGVLPTTSMVLRLFRRKSAPVPEPVPAPAAVPAAPAETPATTAPKAVKPKKAAKKPVGKKAPAKKAKGAKKGK